MKQITDNPASPKGYAGAGRGRRTEDRSKKEKVKWRKYESS
jgi:hypothetical protein